MSSDMKSEIAAAREDVVEALHGPSPQHRLTAARRFLGRLETFRLGGDQALDALERSMSFTDPAATDAAAHIMVALDEPRATERFLSLVERFGSGAKPGTVPSIQPKHLARLGRRSPLPPGRLPPVEKLRRADHPAHASVLFSRPNDEAGAYLDSLLASPNWTSVEAAIEGIAKWPDPDLLRKILDAPPLAKPPGWPADLAPVDVRPHAALHLALLGHADGLERLLEFAHDKNWDRAATAVIRLSWLAHPAGVAPTAALLRSRSNEAVGLALDAVVAYAAAALGLAVIDLAERKIKAKNTLADDAITTLAEWIAGASIERVERLTDVPGDVMTEAERRDALAVARDALAKLDAKLRYREGLPLTLAQLADELTHKDDGPRIAAAYQLRAITGEDYGYDPKDDIIANVEAIEAWRKRAERNDPITPGGWAFLGKPLDPPDVP